MNHKHAVKMVLSTLLLLAMASTMMGQTAQIATSQKTYSVGEGMVVNGTGFTPQVTITLTVERPDHLIDVVAGVTSDTTGAFTANYAPPLEPGRYNFTATDGANSANTATTGADAVGYEKRVYDKAVFDPLDHTGHWTTGNAGSNYQEQQWAFYEYEVTGASTTLPSFDVTFNHFQSNTNAIFVDAFANFRACATGVVSGTGVTTFCADNTDSGGLLLDGSPHPESFVPGPGTTGTSTNAFWIDATGLVGNPSILPSAITDINGTLDVSGNCSAVKDPVNKPSDPHCFHVDGAKLKALINAAYNYQKGNTCPGASCADIFATGTHSVTLYYEAHLAATFVWSKGNEYLLDCAGNLNYVAPGPWVIPFGAPVVYGTDAYKGLNAIPVGGASNDPCSLNNGGGSSGDWTGIFNGIGFATGSSRHFSIANQTAGSNGGLDLPIPSVAAPTGSITIVKVTNPTPAAGVTFPFTDTGTGLSPFTLDTDPATIGILNTQSFAALAGGATYTVTEGTEPTGWSLTNVVCVNNSGASTLTFSPTNPTVSIVLDTAVNASVTCTYTNTGTAKVTIRKTSLGGVGTFNYTSTGGLPSPADGSGNFPITTITAGTPVTATFNSVAPGPYTVTESGPSAIWSFTSLTCTVTGTGTSYTVTTETANLTLAAGGTADCLYTNTLKTATIVIRKTTVGDVGPFSYTTNLTGGSPSVVTAGSFSITTTLQNTPVAETFSSVTAAPAGTAYTVTETLPTNWNFTSLSCGVTGGNGSTGVQDGVNPLKADITIKPGDTVTCDYTNTKQASIVIRKKTLGDVGTFSYTTNLTGGSPSVVTAGSFSITTADQTNFVAETFSNVTAVVAGTAYTVTETLPGTWNLTSLSCGVTGGNGSAGVQDGVNPLKADITIKPGDTVTCDYTNTLKTATIVIKKTTVGGNGTFTYATTLTGGSPVAVATGSFTITTVSNGGTETFSNVTAAAAGTTYTVTESDPTSTPGGWNFTSLTCDVTAAPNGSTGTPSARLATIVIKPGDTVTCTFTNTKLGTITIVKNTVGGNGTFGFTHDVGGNSNPAVLTPFNIITASGTGQQQFLNVVAGTYHVAESGPSAAWIFDKVSCTAGGIGAGQMATIVLPVGGNITCTFVNDKIPTLTIVKNITGTVSGTVTFSYTITGPNAQNPTVGPFTTAPSTMQYGPVQILIGNDTISEDAPPAGWTLTDAGCTGYSGGGTGPGPLDTNGVPTNWNFTAAYGDNVICTYTNSNAKTTRTQGFWATHTRLSNAVWGGNGTTYPPNGSGTPVINPGDPSPAGSPDSYLCGVQITAIPITEENWLMGGFWANIAQMSGKSGKRLPIDQARMQMLQQYLAAILNFHMFGSPPPKPFTGLVGSFAADYCGNSESAIQADIGILGNFNQSGDNLAFDPGQSATAQMSKGQADINAWDAPVAPGSSDETESSTALTLTKVVSNTTGTAVVTDFTLTATCTSGPCLTLGKKGTAAVFSGKGGFSSAAPEGVYTLTDVGNDAAGQGYTPSAWSCTNYGGGVFSVTPTGSGTAMLTLGAGARLNCSIKNSL
ncbi:MAG TPA: hypothetical protein VGR73_01310 [Bryobacteraceae bacterium]|nr:hypothetical protein [Bryobacteraceae bacterium]